MCVDGGVEKVIEDDVGCAWAVGEARDEIADEGGFPGTEEAGDDKHGYAVCGGRSGHGEVLLTETEREMAEGKKIFNANNLQ